MITARIINSKSTFTSCNNSKDTHKPLFPSGQSIVSLPEAGLLAPLANPDGCHYLQRLRLLSIITLEQGYSTGIRAQKPLWACARKAAACDSRCTKRLPNLATENA